MEEDTEADTMAMETTGEEDIMAMATVGWAVMSMADTVATTPATEEGT
jgi:hypothetical protein